MGPVQLVGAAARVLLLVVQLPAMLFTIYLDILTVAAALWRPGVKARPPRTRFAVLVPAHDEELLLPRLLASLRAMEYPAQMYDVHVVADNCSDRTSAIAGEAGASVHERHDTSLMGKGHALRWLLQRLEAASQRYDAYVIVDADTVVAANLLAVFDAHLGRGDTVIQCYYGVLNEDQGWPPMLRYCALTLYNGLRPRGRDALGLSAGLRGNGMCFAAPVLRGAGWSAFALAEDAEFFLQLLEAGVRVVYAGQTQVLAEMPVSLRQAQSQNVRWERGRMQLLRSYGPRLLREGLLRRDPARLDALVELALPPFSAVTAWVGGWLVLTTMTRAHAARRLTILVLIGQAGYVLGGLRMAGAPPRAYAALLMGPPYAAWKLAIYVQAGLGRHDRRWVRTARRGESSR